MKRYLFYTVLSVLAVLTGCRNEEDWGVKQVNGNRTLTASIEPNGLSRTAVNEKGQVTWAETDAIGVFGTSSRNIRFTYQSAIGNGNTATFRGDFPEDESMEQAYYPYQEDIILSGNSLILNLPSEYTYTGNSNAPMLGVKNTDGSFAFKHLTGLLRITVNNVPPEAERFVITSSGTKDAPDLAGQATVADIRTEDAVLSLIANGSKEIVYRLGSLNKETGFRTFFIPLPVGDYPQLSVALYAKDSTEPYFTRTVSDVIVRRAVLIDMPILDAQTGAQYVLSKNTTEITEDMAEHISVSHDDNTKLVYRNGITEEELPEAGRIVFAKVSDNFPDGFLGKVSAIQKNGDGSYTVETTVAALSEAFDELYVNETVALEPLEEPQTRAEGHTHAFDIKLNLSSGDMEWNKEDKSLNIDGRVDNGTRFIVSIALDKERDIQQASFTLENAFKASFTLKANGIFSDVEEELPLIERNFKSIPMAHGLISITPEFFSKLILEAEGTASTELNFDAMFKIYGGAEYRNNQWQKGLKAKDQLGEDKSPWKLAGISSNERFVFQGNVLLGFSMGFNFKLYNQERLKISLAPKAGINLGGQASLIPENLESVENVLSDIKLTSSLDISFPIEIDASLIAPEDSELKTEFTLWGAKLFEMEIPLFPKIKELETKVTLNETSDIAPNPTYTADVSTEVLGHTLLTEAKIAYVIEDETTGEVLETSEPISYTGDVGGELSGDKNPTEMAIPMKTSFKELKQEVSYIVYPVISSPFLNSLINKNEISLKQHAVNINIGKSDREILIEFYKATGGDNWKNNTNWCTDAPLSVWYGIQTDNEGRVTSISLPDNGLINEANLTGLSKLEYLNVNENQLVSLNVSGLNTLSDLYCFNNLLKVLDLSNTVGLTNLNCSSNKLTDINISGLNKLEKFQCVGNELTSLDVSGLNRLKTFDCSSNKLASLDVSNLTNLSDLDCSSNPLISLNTNGCINLEELCSRGYGSVDRDPNLSDLDVSHLVNLVHLNIHCSGITTLNVSGLKKLTKLECSNNKIAELDVSESTSLEYLNCEYNQISVLNVGKLPNLNVLLCGDNQITRLDIAESVNLTHLSCLSNQITELNAAGLVNLISLTCHNNQITKLDVSKLVKLEILYCHTNQITNLDVAELVSLKELLCRNNLLTSLDVSNSIYLEKLDCSFNQLTSLNASGSNRLTWLNIDDNPIRILDISGADNLNDFWISYNEEICPTEKVYLSSSQENLKSKFKLWGNRNYNIYQEPNHRYGFQYPEFIYK